MTDPDYAEGAIVMCMRTADSTVIFADNVRCPCADCGEEIHHRPYVPAHAVKHLSVMTEMNKQGRYDRMTDDLFKLTGQKPISMYDFVKRHASEFTRHGTAA